MAITLGAADASSLHGQNVVVPQLGRDTFAAQCVSILESEIGDLGRRAAIAHSPRHDVLAGEMYVRELARRLLAEGDRTERAGSSAVVAGMCLFRGRGEIDGAFDKLLNRPGEVTNAMSAAQVILHQLAEEPRQETPLNHYELHGLDQALSDLMEPITRALNILEQTTIAPTWVVRSDTEAPAGSGSIDDLDVLGERIAAGPLGPETRPELEAIAEYLARGAAFADLRPSVERYRDQLIELLDFVDTAQAAQWLDEPVRSDLAARVHDAVVLFRDKATRHRGAVRLGRLTAAEPLLVGFTALSGVSRTLDLEAVRVAFVKQLTEADTDEPAPVQWQRLQLILERMIGYRELTEPDLAPDLRVVRRHLDGSYQRAEAALAERMADLLTSSGGLSDPALASLVADHKQYLDDLRRIEQFPGWIDRVRAIDSGAAGPFGGHVRTWSQRLLDTTRRPQATLALDRFERELEQFVPLPLEESLRRGELFAATGGRDAELTRAIDTTRKAWARAWGRGETTSPAGEAMMRLHRLLGAVAATADVVALGHRALVLNRWGAWELDETTFARTVSDIPNRLKLATAAAIEEDERGLDRQLERLEIEVPLARLIGRLAVILEESLSRLPAGPVGVASQLSWPPDPDAWMVGHRRELADVCRYAMEREYARATGRAELTAQLDVYVNDQIERLMDELARSGAAP